MSKKKYVVSIILVFVLILFLSGCSGVNGLKKPKISITFDPNPVSYDSELDKWPFTINLTEITGSEITIEKIRWDEYDQDGRLIYTNTWEEKNSGITNRFGSNYLSAFSSLHNNNAYLFNPDHGLADYIEITVTGLGDKGTPVESSGIVRILPEKDFVRIVSITPNSGLRDGVETEFTGILEYNLISYNKGRLFIGFNNDKKINQYMHELSIDIDKGRGTHEFKVSCKPKDWKNLGDFGVLVCIDEVPAVEKYSLYCHKKILTF